MFEPFVQEEQTRVREQADEIRLKHLPTHTKELASQNFCVLYTTIAFRTKKLASENMATSTFNDANRALENLQQETTGTREITKFEKAQIMMARTGELLQHMTDLAEEIDIITHAQQRREEPKQKQFPVQREKQRQDLMQQLKEAQKEMKRIQGTAPSLKTSQIENKKDNKRKRQGTEQAQDKATKAQEEEDGKEKEERSKEKEHESEKEKQNSEDENTWETIQAAQKSVVKAKSKGIRGRVKATMLILNLTQKQLSFKLDISQGRVSQWMRNKKIADPELIHAQMISFLEKEEGTTQKRTNIGSSSEHAALPGTIDARRATPSSTGTSITTPPGRSPSTRREWPVGGTGEGRGEATGKPGRARISAFLVAFYLSHG
jgi:hypothetical protein